MSFFLALSKQVVIEPTALFKRLVKLGFLSFCWIDPILKHLTHVHILGLNIMIVNGRGAPVPSPK
jgi:hypothetical protein